MHSAKPSALGKRRVSGSDAMSAISAGRSTVLPYYPKCATKVVAPGRPRDQIKDHGRFPTCATAHACQNGPAACRHPVQCRPRPWCTVQKVLVHSTTTGTASPRHLAGLAGSGCVLARSFVHSLDRFKIRSPKRAEGGAGPMGTTAGNNNAKATLQWSPAPGVTHVKGCSRYGIE